MFMREAIAGGDARYTANNFSAVMAKNAKVTIVEVGIFDLTNVLIRRY